jgi:hypothetical protein
LYDNRVPILLLTRPEEAAQAKEALVTKLGFPVQNATVRPARWDFAQLVDWYNYLSPRVFAAKGVVTGDKDEMLNRIHFGVVHDGARRWLADSLVKLRIPCDLVVIEITGPITLFKRTK